MAVPDNKTLPTPNKIKFPLHKVEKLQSTIADAKFSSKSEKVPSDFGFMGYLVDDHLQVVAPKIEYRDKDIVANVLKVDSKNDGKRLLFGPNSALTSTKEAESFVLDLINVPVDYELFLVWFFKKTNEFEVRQRLLPAQLSKKFPKLFKEGKFFGIADQKEVEQLLKAQQIGSFVLWIDNSGSETSIHLDFVESENPEQFSRLTWKLKEAEEGEMITVMVGKKLRRFVKPKALWREENSIWVDLGFEAFVHWILSDSNLLAQVKIDGFNLLQDVPSTSNPLDESDFKLFQMVQPFLLANAEKI